MSLVIIVGIGLLLAFLGLVGVLVWQSRVNPYHEADLFVLPDADRDYDRRLVDLEGADNLRDIGGYAAADGKQVAWGKIYRAGRLDQLTDSDRDRLRALGITLVCDFRMPHEAADMPDALPEAITYKPMPVFRKDPVNRWVVLFNRHRLLDLFADIYVNNIVEEGAAVYGDLIRLAADDANLPLLYHCTAGKDRTGVATALILLTLGVDRQTVIDDYLLTNHSAQTLIDEIQAQLGARNVRGITVEQLYPLLAAAPALIERALDHLDAAYGGAEGYLRQAAGVTAEQIAALRANLLVDESVGLG